MQEQLSEIPEKELHLGRLLGEVNRKLNEGNDFGKIFDFLFDSLNLIIPYDRIGIALVEGDKSSPLICSKWLKTKLPKIYLGAGYCEALSGSSLLKILESGRPRIINDLLEYGKDHPNSHSTQLMLKEGVRSNLTCPLRAEGKIIGLVFFSSSDTETYKNEHIQTYLSIADELSIVIEHGRLRTWFNSDSSREQNLRMVLHDLKNPLNVILNYLEVSQRKSWYKDLNGDIKKIFNTLKRKSNFMVELLNELTELTKLEVDADSLGSRKICLKDFVPDLAIRAREMADRKEINVLICTSSGLPKYAFFNSTKIHRVLDNLVSNAIKFSERGTNLKIHIGYDKERIIFEVIDAGPGIPEEEMCRLFKEFSRTSVAPTEGEQSTGLGLAIAKKIVEQHGGEISVKSQLGHGSTFTFWIPIGGPSEFH